MSFTIEDDTKQKIRAKQNTIKNPAIVSAMSSPTCSDRKLSTLFSLSCVLSFILIIVLLCRKNKNEH